jgi:hypothetical protein
MRYLMILLMPSIIALANPIFDAYITEIQASPDSLERIEVFNPNYDYVWDLSNCQIRTNAGIAIINDSTFIQPESYFVIGHNNTQGVFSLNDTSDSIVVNAHFVEGVYKYPALPAGYEHGPTPPFNGSVALYTYSLGEPDFSNWYIDSTPTFGMENDDWSSISGRVLDQDSNPAYYHEISATGPMGGISYYTFSKEPYCLQGLAAGKYWVQARFSNNWYAYPESIELGYNEHLAGYDIIFPFDAVHEEIRKEKTIPLTMKNQIYDILGREVESKAIISKGVYFKTTETGIKKFVIAH